VTEEGGLRVELRRLAALVGVAGVAIAQPVLDAFGKSPETFIFRDVEGLDVVLFALAVVLVPPLVIWWIGVVVGLLAPRWRVLVQGASIGLLAGLAAVQVLSGLPRAAALALSTACALVAWVLTVRSSAFRLWSELLAGLPAFALVIFLVGSSASEVVSGSAFAAAATSGDAAPVVLIVLDELPTASIIDDAGAIDPVRFPNLARLAGQSTWYRNHTTQSGFTDTAVPTIFTGRNPRHVAPLFTQHPDNIFRLLADSHDLVVSEALTRLCPTSVCGETPRSPASTTDGDADEPAADAGPAMGDLFHDAVDLWTERVAGSEATASFDDFEEEVDSSGSAPSAVSSFGAGEVPEERGTWQQAVASQPARLTDFLAALEPGDRPLAAVLHLVSPHYPWRYLGDGEIYADPASAADLPINGGGDAWVGNLERQRHLLQAGYADRLVGQVLQRLEEVGVFDDAAIVVTADHGIAFSADPNRRLPTREALPEIMWTPLIVKAPGQSEPRVDDANVQSIDVLPTLAALIGVEIPWSVDGIDVAGQDLAARGDRKSFRRFESMADPHPSSDVEVDGAAGFASMLDMAFPPLGPDDDPISSLYGLSGRGDLVGEPYRPTAEVDRDALTVDDLDRLRDSEERVLVLTGTIDDVGDRADHVVAALDGRIVAVSPVVERNIGGRAFALLLPTDRPVDVGQVSLGILRGSELLDAGSLS
jgi:hypothetical protein